MMHTPKPGSVQARQEATVCSCEKLVAALTTNVEMLQGEALPASRADRVMALAVLCDDLAIKLGNIAEAGRSST